jgi:hypothetical protein
MTTRLFHRRTAVLALLALLLATAPAARARAAQDDVLGWQLEHAQRVQRDGILLFALGTALGVFGGLVMSEAICRGHVPGDACISDLPLLGGGISLTIVGAAGIAAGLPLWITGARGQKRARLVPQVRLQEGALLAGLSVSGW